MTDPSRDILNQKLADAIVLGAVPANVAIWLVNLEFIMRLCVTTGSAILIAFAIWAKISRWWAT